MVRNPTRKRYIFLTTFGILLAGIILFFGIYLSDYYRADNNAIAAFSYSSVEVLENSSTIVYAPQEPKAGLIFYPGGKVEHTAYEPLMTACAQQGILCVLVEMPFRLAVLDIDAAHGISERFPEIETWYIGGHSLGGSMAASHLAKNTDMYDGLILLGSYSTSDLSSAGIKVLSIYGSEDRVLNHKKYQSNLANLPSDTTQIILDGGCHAYFGMYGPQKGDGTPSISNPEQITQTAQYISDFIHS